MTSPAWLDGWTKVPAWVSVDPRLSDGERVTLIYVLGRIFGESFSLSHAEIARDRAIGASTARHHLRRLVELDYLAAAGAPGRPIRYARGTALNSPPMEVGGQPPTRKGGRVAPLSEEVPEEGTPLTSGRGTPSVSGRPPRPSADGDPVRQRTTPRPPADGDPVRQRTGSEEESRRREQTREQCARGRAPTPSILELARAAWHSAVSDGGEYLERDSDEEHLLAAAAAVDKLRGDEKLDAALAASAGAFVAVRRQRGAQVAVEWWVEDLAKWAAAGGGYLPALSADERRERVEELARLGREARDRLDLAERNGDQDAVREADAEMRRCWDERQRLEGGRPGPARREPQEPHAGWVPRVVG